MVKEVGEFINGYEYEGLLPITMATPDSLKSFVEKELDSDPQRKIIITMENSFLRVEAANLIRHLNAQGVDPKTAFRVGCYISQVIADDEQKEFNILELNDGDEIINIVNPNTFFEILDIVDENTAEVTRQFNFDPNLIEKVDKYFSKNTPPIKGQATGPSLDDMLKDAKDTLKKFRPDEFISVYLFFDKLSELHSDSRYRNRLLFAPFGYDEEQMERINSNKKNSSANFYQIMDELKKIEGPNSNKAELFRSSIEKFKQMTFTIAETETMGRIPMEMIIPRAKRQNSILNPTNGKVKLLVGMNYGAQEYLPAIGYPIREKVAELTTHVDSEFDSLREQLKGFADEDNMVTGIFLVDRPDEYPLYKILKKVNEPNSGFNKETLSEIEWAANMIIMYMHYKFTENRNLNIEDINKNLNNKIMNMLLSVDNYGNNAFERIYNDVTRGGLSIEAAIARYQVESVEEKSFNIGKVKEGIKSFFKVKK